MSKYILVWTKQKKLKLKISKTCNDVKEIAKKELMQRNASNVLIKKTMKTV